MATMTEENCNTENWVAEDKLEKPEGPLARVFVFLRAFFNWLVDLFSVSPSLSKQALFLPGTSLCCSMFCCLSRKVLKRLQLLNKYSLYEQNNDWEYSTLVFWDFDEYLSASFQAQEDETDT